MTPEQICERLVELGIGSEGEFAGRYEINGAYLWPEKFSSDPRVMAEVMRRGDDIEIGKLSAGHWAVVVNERKSLQANNKSLERAVILAGVRALSDE